MRLLLSLIAKDLRRALANPAGTLISLAIPLAIVSTMALAFGGRGSGDEDHPRIRLVVVDMDGTPLSNMLSGASNSSEVKKHMDLRVATSREKGLELMRDEDYSALLIVPEGFSEELLNGRQTHLELVKNPSQRIMPIVMQQGAEVAALYISAAVRIVDAKDLEMIKNLFEGEGWDKGAELGILIADTYTKLKRADDLLFPPLIKMSTKEHEESGNGGGGFNFISWMFPGMIVMGLLFVGQNQMKDLLREQTAGTLRRQLASPVGPATLIVAKVAATSLVVGAALAMLLGLGWLFFGISWGSFVPLVLVSVSLSLAITGFTSIIASLARTENQADAMGGIVIMLMSVLGGSFIPPQILPSFFEGVSRFTLNYWGNESFRSLVGGGGWEELAATLPVLAAMGVLFTLAGAAFMNRRLARGAV